ncbi:hypothetical protein MSHI_06030 [Mycobacterium shinjukuense]|uniref:Transposase n=1 Tax=Mycobacterium shinjukuense TaxID=398694 RepID=A0A7I7MLP4_9MYCO|nr:hypothetical protein MSHI_06030 [Mycobacterium shinjukuense]
MGRTGSALDNAAAEPVNSTLEWELLRNNHFHTRHSTNGMLRPVDYEKGGGFAAAVLPAERPGRLPGRPSGLKGRYRDRYTTGLRPALDPEPLRPLPAQRHGGRSNGPCPPDRATAPGSDQDQIPTIKSLRLQGMDCLPPPATRSK